jgi:hypothetical protein
LSTGTAIATSLLIAALKNCTGLKRKGKEFKEAVRVLEIEKEKEERKKKLLSSAQLGNSLKKKSVRRTEETEYK